MEGTYIDYYGYVRVYKHNHPNKSRCGCVAKHRLVMEGYLGRYLNKEEVVHHIDGNKLNNDISNLKLFKNDKEHAKEHCKNRPRASSGAFLIHSLLERI